jgi:archaeosine-15-forming tRNA-guanine transglycosylase
MSRSTQTRSRVPNRSQDTKETTLTTKSKQVHDRAEAEFKKQARAQDGRAAASEYGAELLALRTKTERLRALRLAKEAADAAAEAQSAAEAKPAAAPKRR